MTTPDEPEDQPTAEQPPAEQPAAAAPAAEAPGAQPVQPAQSAQSAQSAQPPPYAPYPRYVPYPFAPRVREPWINPAKRAAVTTIAIVAALVLLGAGLLIGAAASGSRGHRDVVSPRIGPGVHMQPGQFPGRLPGRGLHVPRLPQRGPATPSQVPSTSPS